MALLDNYSVILAAPLDNNIVTPVLRWLPMPLVLRCSCPPGKDLEGSFRHPLAREGVYALSRPAFLAHALHKVCNIEGLKAPRLAFFMGNE